jgi:hypothetical protein
VAYTLPDDRFFALVALDCMQAGTGLTEPIPSLDGGLDLVRGAPPIPFQEPWPDWLGSLAAESFKKSTFSIVAHGAEHTTPWYQHRAHALLYGLALLCVARFIDDDGFILVGHSFQGQVTVQTVAKPTPLLAMPWLSCRTLTDELLQRGYKLALAIEKLYKLGPHADPEGTVKSQDHIRIRRGFRCLLSGLRAENMSERLHQFVRAIEAVLCLPKGSSTKKFVYRGALIVGDSTAKKAILQEIYDLRSTEEHLHDWQRVVADDELARLRSVQAEILACDLYIEVLERAGLLAHFVSDATSETFWDGQDKEVRARVRALLPDVLEIERDDLLKSKRILKFW